MRKGAIRIVTQIIAWAIFVCIPFFFSPPGNVHPHFIPIIFPWIYVIGFYYFNFYFLIPRLVFQKRIIPYLIIIIAITGFFIFLPELMFHLEGNIGPVKDLQFNIALGRLAFFLTFLIIFVISSGISILNEFYRYQNNQYQIQMEKSKAELAYFQSQINPHFLFNTLYSIYHLSQNNSQQAPKAILKLSDIMRFMFNESTYPTIPVEKEIEVIAKYIDLQQLRIPEQTRVKFQVKNEHSGKLIAPLLFIPMVENAFKYGISSRQETTIEIGLIIETNQISFHTFNHKISLSGGLEGHHTGLKNIENRLKLLYPGQYEFTIDDQEETFAVTLIIFV